MYFPVSYFSQAVFKFLFSNHLSLFNRLRACQFDSLNLPKIPILYYIYLLAIQLQLSILFCHFSLRLHSLSINEFENIVRFFHSPILLFPSELISLSHLIALILKFARSLFAVPNLWGAVAIFKHVCFLSRAHQVAYLLNQLNIKHPL